MAASSSSSNMSTDVVWEICREFIPLAFSSHRELIFGNWGLGMQNAYLVKRRSGGGVQFSRDPLNLMNKHSRKVWMYPPVEYALAYDLNVLDSMMALSRKRYVSVTHIKVWPYILSKQCSVGATSSVDQRLGIQLSSVVSMRHMSSAGGLERVDMSRCMAEGKTEELGSGHRPERKGRCQAFDQEDVQVI